MARKFYSDIAILTNSALRLFNSTDDFSVNLRSPAAQAADFDLVLPGADTANGAMVSDGAGNLSIALIANANIDSAAAIAVSKLAALTADRAIISDGSGFISAATTTATEIGYVNGVTSSIQTQLNAKASTALNNLSVASLATGSLLVGSSSSAVANLPIGSTGQVLTVAGGTAAWATPSSSPVSVFKNNWVTADTATKAITHSLGTLDIMVQVYDKTDGSTIDVEVVRTSTSVVTVTASEAPPAAGWRVLILAM